jgi:hypothetical protein
MGPLMSFEGYKILEDTQRSREMLNQFYQEQGYEIAPKKQATDHDVQVGDQNVKESQSSAK